MTNCPKCNGTGLIPFRRKDGSIVPYAWVDCECKAEPVEHYQPLTPADFDFPCSSSWRAYYWQEYGGRDPGDIPAPSIATEPEKPKAEPLRQAEREQVAQLKGQLIYIQDKLLEHLRKGKPAKPVAKRESQVKGIPL